MRDSAALMYGLRAWATETPSTISPMPATTNHDGFIGGLAPEPRPRPQV